MWFTTCTYYTAEATTLSDSQVLTVYVTELDAGAKNRRTLEAVTPLSEFRTLGH
jgi:hypothetical protein